MIASNRDLSKTSNFNFNLFVFTLRLFKNKNKHSETQIVTKSFTLRCKKTIIMLWYDITYIFNWRDVFIAPNALVTESLLANINSTAMHREELYVWSSSVNVIKISHVPMLSKFACVHMLSDWDT